MSFHCRDDRFSLTEGHIFVRLVPTDDGSEMFGRTLCHPDTEDGGGGGWGR